MLHTWPGDQDSIPRWAQGEHTLRHGDGIQAVSTDMITESTYAQIQIFMNESTLLSSDYSNFKFTRE